MSFTPRLADANIAIVGLGLMGGSLALALRGKCARLLGIDRNPETAARAARQGVVDLASDNPAELLPQANLIVLAAPVKAILALLDALPDLHPASAVVADLGSTKREIVAAMQALPARFDPIGGHPMCGKERSGLAESDAHLYQNAPFALTPLPRTSPAARRLAEELVLAVGAHVVWIDPETHDQWVAATSHLPYLIANVLAGSTPEEVAPLIGPGYRSASRLALSPVDMMMDVLATNRAPLLAALQRFRARLDLVERCLTTGDDRALEESLAQAASRQTLILEMASQGGDRS